MSGTSLFRPGENCWRVEQADDFAIIIDADDYFGAIRRTMMAAERLIFLVGSDFDVGTTRVIPPALLASWMRFSNLPYLLWWKLHKRISVRLDGRHPLGSAHHQKMLVVDNRTAFCGGIDVTLDRWDAREHLDDNPLRHRPNGRPYGPWHDPSSRFTGEAAG